MPEFKPLHFQLDNSPFPGIDRLAGKPFDPVALKHDQAWCRTVAERQRLNAERLLPYCDEIRTCPICGNASYAVFTTIYGFPYLECESCRHIYCSRVPNEERLKRLYSGTDSLSELQETIYLDEENYPKRVRDIAAPKVSRVTEIVGQRGLWLDIGSGAGEMLQAAKDAGFRVRGIESDRVEADFARRNGFDVLDAFVTESNAKELCADADVISLINVLEHVASPKRLLAAILGAVAPRTRFVMELPRHPSISSLVSLAFPGEAYRHMYPPDHLHVFSEHSLREVFRDLPLRVLSIWNFGQDIRGLLQAVILSSGLAQTRFTDEVQAASSSIQIACDAAGLSDTMLLVCETPGG
jgi:SAM-dependent methyltransferase